MARATPVRSANSPTRHGLRRRRHEWVEATTAPAGASTRPRAGQLFGCQGRAKRRDFLEVPARCPRVATSPERPSGMLELVRDHASSSLVKSYARKTENMRRKYAAVRERRKRTEIFFSGLAPSLLPSLDAPSGASRTTLQTPRPLAIGTLCVAQFCGSIEELGGSRCRP